MSADAGEDVIALSTSQSATLRSQFTDLATQLCADNERLHARAEELMHEVAAWKAGSRELAQQNKLLLADAATYESQSVVLLLLDGDGALFTPSLLKAGREGGREAAMRLKAFVQTQAKSRNALSGRDFTVVAQICQYPCSLGPYDSHDHDEHHR